MESRLPSWCSPHQYDFFPRVVRTRFWRRGQRRLLRSVLSYMIQKWLYSPVTLHNLSSAICASLINEKSFDFNRFHPDHSLRNKGCKRLLLDQEEKKELTGQGTSKTYSHASWKIHVLMSRKAQRWKLIAWLSYANKDALRATFCICVQNRRWIGSRNSWEEVRSWEHSH